MSCKEKLISYLREQGVTFAQRQHLVAYTAQELAEIEHLPSSMVAKVVIVFAGPEILPLMLMLVLPASHRVDLAKVAAAVGARDAWLADERELAQAFPDCELGAMPPFGNLYDLPVYVDRTLAEDQIIVFQAGTHSDTIHMAYADFARLVRPRVLDLLRDARAPAHDL
jgi:Ala-tRNA(Pro) deacylase